MKAICLFVPLVYVRVLSLVLPTSASQHFSNARKRRTAETFTYIFIYLDASPRLASPHLTLPRTHKRSLYLFPPLSTQLISTASTNPIDEHLPSFLPSFPLCVIMSFIIDHRTVSHDLDRRSIIIIIFCTELYCL